MSNAIFNFGNRKIYVYKKVEQFRTAKWCKETFTCFHTTAIKIGNEKILLNTTAEIYEYYPLQAKDEKTDMTASSCVKMCKPKVW